MRINAIVRTTSASLLAVTATFGGDTMTFSVSKNAVDDETWDPVAKMICNEFAMRFERDPYTFRQQNFGPLMEYLQRGYLRPPPRATQPQPKTDFRKAHEGVREKYTPPEPQEITPLPMAKLRQQFAIRTLGDFWRWLKKILLIS